MLRSIKPVASPLAKTNESPGNASRRDIHNSDVPMVCQACEARHRGICGVLSPDELLKLSRHTTRQVFEAGKEIMAFGQDVHRYFNILRGVVKLSKLSADGRQQIVGLQFAPDLLGRPYQAQSDISVEAATIISVCSFPKSELESLAKDSPDLEHRLHLQTLKELDEARNWMLTLGRKSASEKVASFLYLIACHHDPEANTTQKPISFVIPLRRTDIADFLGLTIETVSRQMTKLRKDGVIDIVDHRTVTVPDLGKLKALTEVSE
jgi:CRP/FNR family transcriptional regulator